MAPGRSSLWSAIWLAVGEPPSGGGSARDDLLWNLRTWPLELVKWPVSCRTPPACWVRNQASGNAPLLQVSNALRRDLLFERGIDRFGRSGAQSRYTRSPIPANERTQQRWNSNPFEVIGGGSGMSESDPGAWLLPYWMARYHGLLADAAPAPYMHVK